MSEGVKYSDILRKAYEVRALIANKKFGAARDRAHDLNDMLTELYPTPPLHLEEVGPLQVISDVIDQGEAGSAFGMVLEMRGLLKALDAKTAAKTYA